MTLNNTQLLQTIDDLLNIATIEDNDFLYTYSITGEVINKIPLYKSSKLEKEDNVTPIYNSSFTKLLIYKCPKGQTYPNHYHNYKEHFYILEGKAKITVDGETTILSEGNKLLVDTYKLHNFEALEDTKVLLLMILT